MQEFGLIFAFFLAVLVYFLPSLVALDRKHKDAAGVAILNFALGWTLLFWVVALAWAASGARGGATEQSAAAPSPPPQALTTVEEIERLAALRQSGAISEVEFQNLKAAALARLGDRA